MEKLPVEIASMIFAPACLDGGFTGSSLSLVSKRVRSLSAPSQFHSISITAENDRFSTLLSTLANREPQFRQVRYLHLCRKITDEDEAWKDPGIYSADEVERCNEAKTLVNAILGLTSSRLLVLSIVLTSPGYHLPVDTCFPNLVDLTADSMIRTAGYSEAYHLPKGPLIHPDTLPSLNRLHLISSNRKSLEGWPALFKHITAAAPRLNDLRLSGVTPSVELRNCIQQEVQSRGNGTSILLPITLRRILIQNRLLRSRYHDGTHNNRAVALIEAALQVGSPDLPIKILGSADYSETNAKADWEDIVRGGDGCWIYTRR